MPQPPAAITNSPSSVLHRDIHVSPPLVTSADGITLTLHTGQIILDASSGAAVSCLGHAHPRIKAAVAKQLDTVAYCHSLFYGTQAAEDLARELVAGTGGIMAKVYVVSSGRLIHLGCPETGTVEAVQIADFRLGVRVQVPRPWMQR
jgi:adenosylmethionine-8-amino-7-oxononanoate aminotransferase